MIEIEGINISFDINQLIKVSDLVNYEGPLLSHYISPKGENYLFYWVDVDDDFNRWLFFRVDLINLQDYIDKKVSLLNVILNQQDGFVYSVDIDNDTKYHNLKLIPLSRIEQSYLPEIDSFFELEPIDSIDLASFSNKFKTGVLEFRITGENVKYGSISLSKLAPIIPKIEDVRKTLASKYIKTRKKNFSEASRDINTKMLLLDTQYDFVYSLAGSFRIILKPIGEQSQIQGFKGFSDEFAEEIIKLFNSGYNIDEINDFANRYNKSLIKKYNDFIYFLQENKLGIDVKWYNSRSNSFYSQSIRNKDTLSILSNLSNFNFNETEELKYRGRFFAINTHTGRYSFESIEGDDFKSIGSFDETRKQMAFTVSFNKTYEVTILRKTVEKVGIPEKITDTITSFYEVSE